MVCPEPAIDRQRYFERTQLWCNPRVVQRRIVSVHLKPNMLSDYTRTVENDILPLLRKQKGFKDEITLSNPGSLDAIAISLWENKANAEAYNANAYQGVLKTFARMIDGTPKVQTFETVTSTFHNVAVAV